MKRYSQYVKKLEALVWGYRTLDDSHKNERCAAALDGEPSRELRRLATLNQRRNDGVFFTGSTLAGEALSRVKIKNTRKILFFDPACGAGDLLLAAARNFPIRPGLAETIRFWSRHLAGCDKHGEFVRAAKLCDAWITMYLAAKDRRKIAPPPGLLRWLAARAFAAGIYLELEKENGDTPPDIDDMEGELKKRLVDLWRSDTRALWPQMDPKKGDPNYKGKKTGGRF